MRKQRAHRHEKSRPARTVKQPAAAELPLTVGGFKRGTGNPGGSGEFFNNERCASFGAEYGLSGREVSIVRLTCQGMTRRQIAQALGIALDSVHKYCDRVHKKLGVKDRVGLILKVVHFIHAS